MYVSHDGQYCEFDQKRQDAARLIQRCYRQWKTTHLNFNPDTSSALHSKQNQSTETMQTEVTIDAEVYCSLENEVLEGMKGSDSSESQMTRTEVAWDRKWNGQNLDALRRSKVEEENLKSSTRSKVDAIMQMLRDAETQNARTLSHMQTAVIFQNTTSKQTSKQKSILSSSWSRVLDPTTDLKCSSVAETVLAKFRSKIEGLRKEVDSKEATIVRLKGELEGQHQKHKEELEAALQIEKARFEQQLQIHNSDLEKRLKFIDALLQDKEKWVKQSEQLTKDLKNQQDAYDAQLKSLKDRMAAELRKQRHDWNLKENEKRERWMKEQKEEILHTTAKAMEPKFSAMTEQHKEEIRRLKDKIEAQDRVLSQQEEHTIQLRQRLLQEREDCLEKERLRSHAQLSSEKEKLRINLEAEMEKTKRQWKEEKDSLLSAMEDLKLQTERKLHQLQDTHSRALQRMDDHQESEKEKIFADTKAQIERVKQECNQSKEEWKENTMDNLHHKMLEELETAKNLLERERDEEIEVVITRFEAEKEELESDLRRRIVQLQHENAEQIKSLNNKEDQIGKLSTELSRMKEQLEDSFAREQELQRKQDEELEASKKSEADLYQKVCNVQEEHERTNQLHREAMITLKEELQQQLAELEASRAVVVSDLEVSKQENDKLRVRYQEELDVLTAHVNDALGRKDAFIASLQSMLDSKAEERQSMEQLLLDETCRLEEKH